MLATARPAHAFFQKQATVAPKATTKYDAWLAKEDKRQLGYLSGLAQQHAAAKAANRPFKKPSMKGFELRFYEDQLAQYSAKLAE